MTRNVLLIACALVAFGVALVLELGWFGTHAPVAHMLAADTVGLGFFAAAHLP